MNSVALQVANNLTAKVDALSSADFYGEACTHIDCIETHMSWVFLTPRYAYKLKKPVRWSYLDFSTLAAREYYCREELKLNRRLAASAYLDVVPLRCDSGRLRLGGDHGEVVDYLIKMIRLPTEKMLDRMLCSHLLKPEDIRALALVLADFYRYARAIDIAPDHYLKRLIAAIDDDCNQLNTPRYDLPHERIRAVTAVLLDYIDTTDELSKRAAHVIDAHGDLRPEHIYLGQPIQIIDCLEFDSELRQLDPVDELAFFGLECARLGAPHVGRAVLRMYRLLIGDFVSDKLIAFYQASRALTRAVLAIWHLDDPAVMNRKHWRERALTYIAMAEQASEKIRVRKAHD